MDIDPQAIPQQVNGLWGVTAILLPPARPFFLLRPDDVFPAASVIKVPILVELYRQAIEKGLDLGTLTRVTDEFHSNGSGTLQSLSDQVVMTLHDLAVLMIHLSDNTAANVLIARLGRDNINRTMSGLMLERTALWTDCIDPAAERSAGRPFATTTPRDMANLFVHLAREDILTPAACHDILDLMKRDTNRWRIVGQLPLRSDLVIHHKTGTMHDVYNDVGLVRFSGGQYVISILSKGIEVPEDPRWPNAAEEAIAHFSRRVFDQVEQGGFDNG